MGQVYINMTFIPRRKCQIHNIEVIMFQSFDYQSNFSTHLKIHQRYDNAFVTIVLCVCVYWFSEIMECYGRPLKE